MTKRQFPLRRWLRALRPREVLVFVSSPGDCATERDVARRAVMELNDWPEATRQGVRFRPLLWEDLPPGIAEEGDFQRRIDALMRRFGYDAFGIYLGLMKGRLGTPTPRFRSGTVEELETSLRRRRRTGMPAEILFYFVTPEANDVAEVREFRAELEARGLILAAASPVDLPARLEKNLREIAGSWSSWRNVARRQRVPIAVAGVLLLASLASGWKYYDVWRGGQAEQATNLAAQARDAAARGAFAEGLQLVLRALPDGGVFTLPESPQASSTLADMLQMVPRASLSGHRASVVTVLWSPNGRYLATASRDGTARLWDGTTGNELNQLSSHTHALSSASWSANSRLLATGSDDGTARVWEAATGREVQVLRGSGSSSVVTTVAWSPEEAKLATGSWGQTVRVWDATGREIEVLRVDADDGLGIVLDVAWSPDGTRLAASSGGTVTVWDLTTGGQPLVLGSRSGSLSQIAWSPDGRLVVAASTDAGVHVWEASTGNELHVLDAASPFAWSPDSRQLVTATRDLTARLWDATTGELSATLRARPRGEDPDPWWLENSIWQPSVAWSPDGERIALTAWDGTVWLWSALTRKELAVLHGSNNMVGPVAFSPDGKRLAHATDEVDGGPTLIWDLSWLELDLMGRIAFAREVLGRLRPHAQVNTGAGDRTSH